MDFREEYFERKLKHVGEEMTLISKQLMLIQDFIVFEFGSSFKSFCESRRGGRFFRESNALHESHGDNSNTTKGSGVRRPVIRKVGNISSDVDRMVGATNRDSCGHTITSSGQPLSSDLSSATVQPQRSQPSSSSCFAGDSRDWNQPNVSTGIDSESMHHQVQPTNATQVQNTASTVVIPNDTKVLGTFADESEEGENAFDPLGDDVGDPENDDGVDQEVVFVKCEPGNGSILEEFSVDDTGNEEPIEGFVSQQGFMPGTHSEMPCSSYSVNQLTFQKPKQIPNSSLNNFGIEEDGSNSRMAKGLKRGRITNVGLKMADVYKEIPWKINYRKLSNGQIMCSFKHCNKRFRDIPKFKRHFLQHTGIKPYKCDQCPADYTRNDQLTQHKSKHHTDSPHPSSVFYCKMCNLTFSSKSSYKSHACPST